MARLELNFSKPEYRPGWTALLFLLSGVAALAWVADAWVTRNTQVHRLQQAIDQTAHRAPVVRVVPPNETAARAARDGVDERLAASWQTPLHALEAVRSSKVALISLDANQSNRQLRLVAEARQLADVVAYVEALQQQSAIKRAVLTQHEFRSDTAEQPVRFHVAVEWRL